YDVSVFDLVSALKRILTEAPAEPEHAVSREEDHIEEQQYFLLDALQKSSRISFAETVRGRSEPFVITTFLAVLELARQQRSWLLLDDDEAGELWLASRAPPWSTDGATTAEATRRPPPCQQSATTTQ